MDSKGYLLVFLTLILALSNSINTCEFAYSSSENPSEEGFHNFADYDPTSDMFYLVRGFEAMVLQFDVSGTVLNVCRVSSSDIKGAIVFSSGGKIWVYGPQGASSYVFVLNEDFSIASNRKYASSNIHKGASNVTLRFNNL